MRAIKAIFGWVFRNAILFALIVAALLTHAVWSQGRDAELKQTKTAAQQIEALAQTREQAEAIRRDAEREAQQAGEELGKLAEDLRDASIAKLREARSETQRELRRSQQTLPSTFEETRQVLTGDTQSIATTAFTRIEIAKLERQLAFLNESIDIAEDNRPLRNRLSTLAMDLTEAESLLKEAETNCTNATNALQQFETRSLVGRFFAGGNRERRTLESQKTSACLGRDAAERARNAVDGAIASTRDAIDSGKAEIDTAIVAATDALDELDRQAQKRQAELTQGVEEARNGLGQIAERYELARQARTALLILLAIIATPFLIRTLFYYVFAPLAERRAAIRIALPNAEPNTGTPPISPSDPSRISIPVTLERGEELLIRQDYLQTSPVEAVKETRWLLDYGHPLSSIATGLFFLTRVRGSGSTTVSAVKDPFAELTQIALPRSASCVLHPRALVALVQPVGETMRITSHWRLFSLNAWLTMQLRFMVFHGPGRLIVKGGRGVRVEQAEAGRVFGQDQLVGFSADLSYSVTRTETFAPYLFGREQLFKDKVEEGDGLLIIEEAPYAGRAGSEVRRGLEGAFDAGMKAFGL